MTKQTYRLFNVINMDFDNATIIDNLSAREAVLLKDALANEQLRNSYISDNLFDIQEWDSSEQEWYTAYTDEGEELSKLSVEEL